MYILLRWKNITQIASVAPLTQYWFSEEEGVLNFSWAMISGCGAALACSLDTHNGWDTYFHPGSTAPYLDGIYCYHMRHCQQAWFCLSVWAVFLGSPQITLLNGFPPDGIFNAIVSLYIGLNLDFSMNILVKSPFDLRWPSIWCFCFCHIVEILSSYGQKSPHPDLKK